MIARYYPLMIAVPIVLTLAAMLLTGIALFQSMGTTLCV